MVEQNTNVKKTPIQFNSIKSGLLAAAALIALLLILNELNLNSLAVLIIMLGVVCFGFIYHRFIAFKRKAGFFHITNALKITAFYGMSFSLSFTVVILLLFAIAGLQLAPDIFQRSEFIIPSFYFFIFFLGLIFSMLSSLIGFQFLKTPREGEA